MFTTKDISRYYDLSEVHYNLFWDLKKSKSLHYGYWNASTKNFHEAVLNINKVLAYKAAINKDDKVLDAGCGVGGSSIWLATQVGCKVTSVSLNKNQIEKATAYAKGAGVSHLVKFEQNNYLNTGYADASFDIIWAIESVCYADDKKDFIEEAYRLLKPGGRLIVADFFKTEDLNKADDEAVRRWANGWAINDFTTAENFQQSLIKTGFTDIEIEDASKAIMPSAKRLYRAYFIGKPAAFLYNIFKRNVTTLSKGKVETAYQQYKTLKKGLWKYGIVKALKK